MGIGPEFPWYSIQISLVELKPKPNRFNLITDYFDIWFLACQSFRWIVDVDQIFSRFRFKRRKFVRARHTLENNTLNQQIESILYFAMFTVLDMSGDWGINPLWCLSTLSLNSPPRKIVNISQKYIAGFPKKYKNTLLVSPQIEYCIRFSTSLKSSASLVYLYERLCCMPVFYIHQTRKTDDIL